MYNAGIVDGGTLVAMQGDFVDVWERAVPDGTSVRQIVGEDPAGFADEFVAAYTGRKWTDMERKRLVDALVAAAAETDR